MQIWELNQGLRGGVEGEFCASVERRERQNGSSKQGTSPLKEGLGKEKRTTFEKKSLLHEEKGGKCGPLLRGDEAGFPKREDP